MVRSLDWVHRKKRFSVPGFGALHSLSKLIFRGFLYWFRNP